mgnify:FL=1
MSDKNIVVVGAGYAGVHATKRLAKKFKKDPSVKITLIDRHSYHTMMTELHEVAAHRVEPEAIQFDLQKLFCRLKNVNLVTDNVTNVDTDKKVVETEHGSYPYDYLILGLGSEPNDYGTPGVKEHAFTLWSFEDAVRLREHIEKTVAKAALVRDEAVRKAMLTFVVCGSGFTGVEMIGELIEWKERLAIDNKIKPEEISLYLVEAAPTILNIFDDKDAAKAEKYMVKNGVKILKSSPIVEVKEDRVVLKSGEELPTHTLIWTAGIKANSDTADYGLETARAGRIKVNEYMQAEGMKDVYVVGDLAYYEEAEGKPTPQIVEAAEQTGATAAKNIIADIRGGEKGASEGKYHGFMCSIGARYGVANLMGIRLSGFWANLVKHLVNLYYFFGLRSGYYMVEYIKHEFFQTKDKRNIFRDITTRYGNVLWSFPLRIWLGLFWIGEAGSKLWGASVWDEATSSIKNLGLLFKGLGEDSWLVDESVKMPFEWLQVANTAASTSATTAASQAAEAATYAEPILSKMPGWFEWIMQIMLPTPEMAIFMQKMVVFIELAIGLAILFGLFTWLASAGSTAFLGVFIFSAMLGWDKFWALPASIALMNGAGRGLGLDYWVLPWLGKKLGRLWYGEEKSIYP